MKIGKIISIGKRILTPIFTSKPRKIEGLVMKTLDRDVVQLSKSVARTGTIAETEGISKAITKNDAFVRAAERATDDVEVQKALIELSKKEGIIIRTKEDAIPILKRQYQSLSQEAKENLYVLNINPQTNNGMQKSNTLISQWYAEANGIDSSRIITLNLEEMTDKMLSPQKICSIWKQGNKTASSIAKKVGKIKPGENPMSLDRARKLLAEIKGLPEEEILKKTSIDEIAQAIQKVNTTLIQPFKQGGYTSSLATQIQEVIAKSEGKVHFVIPDDCSLSGSSIICDTARIIERVFNKGNIDSKKVEFIFSPMIYGEKAEEMIGKFVSKQGLCDETFLTRINAIAADGSEKVVGAKKVFQTIEDLNNVEFKVSGGAQKAVHFTKTETFKKIGEQNPKLQQKLLYIMQGPMSESGHIYGGFGDCGVMVITPTESFVIDGVTYAGKVPTNSVGYMEAIGLESGVLNDFLSKDAKGKGLFMKGTGKGYQRYIEWEGLAKPTLFSDRIPIFIEGSTIKKAS